MKNLLILLIFLSGTSVFSQDLDSIKNNEKQMWKDSVYFNRFNKENYHIGGMPLVGWSRGDLGKIDWDQYGLHSEFGYFIRKKVLLFIDNTTVFNKYKHKTYANEKIYSFYTFISPGIRYYLKPKRFTFFAQTKISYSYNIDNTELVTDFKPANFHRFDITPGIGATFSANIFDISLAINYTYPFYYSNYVNYERIASMGYVGTLFTPSIYFTF